MSTPTTDNSGAANSQPRASTSVRGVAPAKINLTLAVLARRPDGYHDIESLVLPLSLTDELDFLDEPNGEITIRCPWNDVPTGPDNLIWKAAEQLRPHLAGFAGVRVHLTKRIPLGAGLGGGSSDAAAALIGLNRLWGLGLDKDALIRIAGRIGSDVALFLEDGPAIIRGRGEVVQPVALDWSGWIVLVIPRFGMSTPAVYGACRPGEPPRTAEDVVEACRAGKPLADLLFNMLEQPAMELEPRLASLRKNLVDLGATQVRMSGSGSSMFALYEDEEAARTFARRAGEQLDAEIHVLQSLSSKHL